MSELTVLNTRISLNKSGNYEIRWTDRNAAGKPCTRSVSCGTKSEREAEAFRDAWLSAGQAINDAAAGKAVTLEDVIAAYLSDHVELHGKSDAQRWSLLPVRRALGTVGTVALKSPLFIRYIKDRRTAGIADGTIRRELGAVRAALDWSVKNGVLPEDFRLPHIALPASGAARTNYLTRAENDRMFALAEARVRNAKDIRFAKIGLFICLALETAARSSAADHLTWDRVDITNRLIDFRDPGIRASKKRRALVPISDKLLPVLEFARQTWGGKGYVMGRSGHTRHQFERFVEAHGFDCTRHDLRRTWATLRAQAGVDLFAIAGVLGDTIETVTKHYAHHHPDFLRKAMDLK